MHPDTAGLAAVDITNPQSWNRYSYVQNSPLNMVDPLGLREAMPGQCPQVSIDGVAVYDSWDGGCAAGGWFVRAILSMDAGAICPGDCSLVRQGADGFYQVTAESIFTVWLSRPQYCDDSGWSGTTIMDMGWHGWETMPLDTSYWSLVGAPWLGTNVFNNVDRGGDTVRATPKLKFRPPSWQNFTHEFLPCYGAQLLDNFVGNEDKTYATIGTVALAVTKPKLGGPLLLLWAGINGPKAGAACAFASRAVYQ